MSFYSSFKRVFAFALITIGITVLSASAQAPQGMNYQAIARDNAGLILPNQSIGLRLTITNGNGGSVLYQETQTTATNPFGLFTVKVGGGAVVSGNFSTIAWATVTPWLKVEMDPTGSTNYVNMGSSQLLSVPYALYAASAGGASSLNGTANHVVKFTGATTGGNSQIYDDGTNIGIGTVTPGYLFHVKGSSSSALGVFSNADASGNAALAGQNEANAGTGSGNGIFGATQQSAGVGIYGLNLNSAGTGMLGVGNGVNTYTFPTGGAGGAFYGGVTGAYGFSAGTSGYGVYGKATNPSSAYGVVGVANGVSGGAPSSGAGGAFSGFDYGVSAVQTDQAASVQTAGGYFVNGYNNGSSISTTLVDAFSVANTHYKIWGSPAGTVSTTVSDLNNNQVTLHAPETPEFYFQDYGQSQLVNGKAHIDLDPILAKNVAINDQHPLRVFVQLEGDCKGVFVTNKTATGFDVVELGGGTSNVTFQWSVTCNVADMQIGNRLSKFSGLRFEAGPVNQLQQLRQDTSTNK